MDKFIQMLRLEVEEFRDTMNLASDVQSIMTTTNRDYETKDRVLDYLGKQEMKQRIKLIGRMKMLNLLDSKLVHDTLTQYINIHRET